MSVRSRRLWAVASALVLLPVVWHVVSARYHGAIDSGPGVDFRTFVAAANEVRAGGSPYTIGAYVYSPALALLLAPFAEMPLGALWHGWTLAAVGAMLAACGVCVGALRVPSWLAPGAFAAFCISLFHFWPTTTELFLGNVDSFVLLILAGGAFAATRPRTSGVGSAVGAAALLKTWPIAIAIFLGRRIEAARVRREAVALVAWLAAGAVVLLATGGVGGLRDLFDQTFDKSSQPGLVSLSAIGVPRLAFSGGAGLAPVVDSSLLQIATTLISFLVIGIALLVAVRSAGADAYLGWWTTVAGVILLLPVSHPMYRILVLPLAWGWAVRAMRVRDAASVAMGAIGLAWWLLTQQIQVSSTGASVGRYATLFVADLVLVLGSSAAMWWYGRDPDSRRVLLRPGRVPGSSQD